MQSGRSKRSLRVVTAAVVSVLAVLVVAGPAGAQRDPVVPPGPLGTSYSEWAARWWQWALAQPAAVNPIRDTTGQFCTRGQRGPMWFLAGTSGGPAVPRRCTVPRGKSLLFPIDNQFAGAAPSDLPEQRTEGFQRAQVTQVAGATNLALRVDGAAVPALNRFFELSRVFRVVLPADNLLRVDASCQPAEPVTAGCVIFPTVDAGFYVALRPLSVGRHRIHFTGTIPPSAPGGTSTTV